MHACTGVRGYLPGIYFCISFARTFCPRMNDGWDDAGDCERVLCALESAALALEQPFFTVI